MRNKKMDNKSEKLNMMLAGVGGQGLITLTQVMGQLALLDGVEFRSSELHGLSQRGGSVNIHVRLGKKINSPLITPGDLNLALALESQEALTCAQYASEETEFLINEYQTPTLSESASNKEVMERLRDISDRLKLVPATKICKREFDTGVVAGVFMLGYAFRRDHFDFNQELFSKAIERQIPEKYWEMNKEAFELGLNYKGQK
ncbi:MAG: 2-oxoacid:acceptor oxidoreductase family protein [Candidatus Paceibacterota bacterium]